MSAVVTICVISRPIGRAVICPSSTGPSPELACVESVLAILAGLRATELLAPAGLGAIATVWLAFASWDGIGGASPVAPAGPVSPATATSLPSRFLGRADPEDKSLGVLLV